MCATKPVKFNVAVLGALKKLVAKLTSKHIHKIRSMKKEALHTLSYTLCFDQKHHSSLSEVTTWVRLLAFLNKQVKETVMLLKLTFVSRRNEFFSP